MSEIIEIPFGAKDSELGGWEYNIPEGFLASIENGKIIVKKENDEDEKTRKEIILALQYANHKGIYDKHLTWLEKQGEKPTDEVKEVDLERDAVSFCFDNGLNTTPHIAKTIAKHFFELGLKANQEDNVIGTIEREVKIDAGGYPCIDCYIEFYDYEKDIPLAKKGDKIKVIMVKEK